MTKSGSKVAEEARVRVVQARDRLGDAVEQLASKADVKGRTGRSPVTVAGVRGQVQKKAGKAVHLVQDHAPVAIRRHPGHVALAGGAVALATAVLLGLRRSARKRKQG